MGSFAILLWSSLLDYVLVGGSKVRRGVRGGHREGGVEVRLEERWGRRTGKEGGGGSLTLTLILSNLIFSIV